MQPDKNVQAVFQALSDPTRRRILDLLRQRGEARASAISDWIPTQARTGISRHLRVLSTARLVHSRKQGREQRYRLNQEGFDTVQQRFFDRYTDVWRAELTNLKRLAEADETE